MIGGHNAREMLKSDIMGDGCEELMDAAEHRNTIIYYCWKTHAVCVKPKMGKTLKIIL